MRSAAGRGRCRRRARRRTRSAPSGRCRRCGSATTTASTISSALTSRENTTRRFGWSVAVRISRASIALPTHSAASTVSVAQTSACRTSQIDIRCRPTWNSIASSPSTITGSTPTRYSANRAPHHERDAALERGEHAARREHVPQRVDEDPDQRRRAGERHRQIEQADVHVRPQGRARDDDQDEHEQREQDPLEPAGAELPFPARCRAPAGARRLSRPARRPTRAAGTRRCAAEVLPDRKSRFWNSRSGLPSLQPRISARRELGACRRRGQKQGEYRPRPHVMRSISAPKKPSVPCTSGRRRR